MSFIKQFRHIILYVDDMATEVAFYRDTLELTMLTPEKEDYSTEMWVEFDAGGVTLTLHGGGKAPHVSSTPKLVFEVSDIRAVHEKLTARGVYLSEIKEGDPGVLTASGHDPEGILFSIDQIMADLSE